jgi:hypothetical protein
MPKLVRLKRFEPKRGMVLRRLHIFGRRFEEVVGWYKVDDDLAAKLSDVRQPSSGKVDDPPFAFDVKTEAEALAVEKKEAAEVRAGAETPRDLTTKDLPAASRAAPAARAPGRRARGGASAAGSSEEPSGTSADVPDPFDASGG